MSTTRVGDVSIPVGTYTDREGKERRRGRKIGDLFVTTHDGRDDSYWIKLNADALSSSLLILLSRNALIEKGEDGVILNVYPPREETGKPSAPPSEKADGDGPF